jgi:hypothetical protein
MSRLQSWVARLLLLMMMKTLHLLRLHLTALQPPLLRRSRWLLLLRPGLLVLPAAAASLCFCRWGAA